MSYRALYRIWRPTTFDDMVGQRVIKTTLKNAIQQDQLSHAYLFTGPRGTGKTSTAKIIAKAINCLNPQDGNPCNQCEICQGIQSGQLSDIIEIDAASNNGVTEIRDLRESVRYAPSEAAYKVYIIDEVHMLTTAAFNALLKTLEEPPDQVVFILATTEPHKIPATILSRVQRFDFQRIVTEDIIGRMQEILDYDHIDYDSEALAIIARAANGGMRDSLSMLDQALAFQPNHLSLDAALEVSGSLNQADLAQYIMALYRCEGEDALHWVQDQLQKGKQASRFIEEVIMLSRDLLLTKRLNTNQTLLTQEELAKISEMIPPEYYYGLIESLNQTQDKMRWSTQPDLYLEVMTIELAQDKYTAEIPNEGRAIIEQISNPDFQELSEHIQKLESELHELRRQQATHTLSPQHASRRDDTKDVEEPATSEPLIPRERPQRDQVEYELNLNQVYRILNEATHTHINAIKSHWNDILQYLTPRERAMFNHAQSLAAGPAGVLISVENPTYCGTLQHNQALNEQLLQAITAETDYSLAPTYILSSEWRGVRKQYTLLRQENHGQPIPIEDESTFESANTTQVTQDDDGEESVADREAEKSELVSEDKITSQDNPVSDDSLSESPVQALHNEEKRQSLSPLNEPDMDKEADETQEDTQEDIPDIVQQAYDLFGEDDVNIIDA